MRTVNSYTRPTLAVIALFVATLCGATAANAAGFSNARTAGMAGAHLGLASGATAAYYNPANLGLSTHQQRGLLLAGVGVNVSNNSFTLDDYNTYNGALLTDADKRDILGKIPIDGFTLNADAEISAAGFSFGQYALTFSGYGASELNLGHDVVELFFYGNQLNDTISLEGMYGAAWSYASVDFTFGAPVYTMANRQLAAGFTFHYLKGLHIADVTRINGSASTLATGFEGSGELVARTAEGGAGYALDLGAALQLNRDYTVGISLKNFISSINWDQNAEENGFRFAFDSVNVQNSSSDSVVVTDEYTNALSGFKSSLPTTMRLGIANTTGKLLWAFDWEQGFKHAPGVSSKPQFSLGAEYSLINFLPLRAGYSLGGRFGSHFSLGSGLSFPFFYLDAAFLTSGGGTSAYGSKGARFAFSTGLKF